VNRRPSRDSFDSPDPSAIGWKKPNESDVQQLAEQLQASQRAYASIYGLSVAQSTLREALDNLMSAAKGQKLAADDRAYATVALRGGIDYATALLTEAYDKLNVANASAEHILNHDHEKSGGSVLMDAALARISDEDIARAQSHRYDPIRPLSLDRQQEESIMRYLQGPAGNWDDRTRLDETGHQDEVGSVVSSDVQERCATALYTYLDVLSESTAAPEKLPSQVDAGAYTVEENGETLMNDIRSHFKPERLWNLTVPLSCSAPSQADSTVAIGERGDAPEVADEVTLIDVCR
jgi:hypothetical protein